MIIYELNEYRCYLSCHYINCTICIFLSIFHTTVSSKSFEHIHNNLGTYQCQAGGAGGGGGG